MQSEEASFDIAIIGGGINGTAIARDAAGRNLRVLLVEQDDLGAGTSSTSTKLIHGGLRYLEHGAFKLVREGLYERALLLQMAPHLIWPCRFVLPHHKALRPVWLLRLGLFIYDTLGGKSLLPASRRLDLAGDEAGAALQPAYRTAFEYSDCCVDDARLVVINAVDASERGAKIRTRTRYEGAERKSGIWHITLNAQGQRETATAQALINASGPWIEGVNKAIPQSAVRPGIKLVKGSHIVVPRLFDHSNAYIFQNADGRIVFAIPYERDFTLIGTTEVPFAGDPASAAASSEETAYLCKVSNDYFRKAITPADAVWTFAGVRALYDNRSVSAKDLSRDYLLELEAENGKAPLLSIYGGKLTAARHLAEMALQRLAPFLPMDKAWTGKAPLPGGDFPWDGFDEQVLRARSRWPFLAPAHAARLIRAYGTRVDRILGDARSMGALGACFGGDLTENEVRYLMQQEWARTTDDLLWRRSKLGLRLTPPETEKLARFMGDNA
jgi:glycerol-3-phosphate dehydrogenase